MKEERTNIMKKIIAIVVCLVTLIGVTGCQYQETRQNIINTKEATEKIISNQQTPVDLEYSLERYNLIKRAYWVNGQREKAMAVPCNVEKPIGYITLIAGNAILAQYTVDGKITSLNSYLSADSERYATSSTSDWLADVDGSYGSNVEGVFWFDCDGNYHEWTGEYHYSDIPLHINDPKVYIQEVD